MTSRPPTALSGACARLGVPREVPGAAVDLLADELHALWAREYANIRASASYRVGRTLLGPLIALRDSRRRFPRIDWPRVEHLLGRLRPFIPADGPPPRPDEVTAIVPTRDRVDLLRACVASLRRTAPRMRICIVDNGSADRAALAHLAEVSADPAVRVVRDDGPFNFARLNNRAAAAAESDVMLLVNNDVEAVRAGWLEAMLAPLGDPSVGIVGARLDYPDGRLQHAGIALGMGGVAGHPGRGASPADAPRLRFPEMTFECTAVTAACMAVRRAAWEEAGGMDEAFAVAFNDIDFCLRAGSRGWRCVMAADSVLVHREGQSRGADDTPAKVAAFYREFALMRARWGPLLDEDPCFPPELAGALRHP